MEHFFLDRGLGSRIVPEGLRTHGWSVTTMDERYGPSVSQKIADTEWISDAAGRGDCIITKDSRIASRPAEAEVVDVTGARVFAIKNAHLTGPQMLELLLQHEAAIRSWVGRVDGPFVVGLGPVRAARLRLNSRRL